MNVRYLRYFGERENGTVIIKSVKSNSPLRVFDYVKGMNLRVGADVHEEQVKFLVRNHRDLFRVVEEEEVPEDILVMEIFRFLPKMTNDLNLGAAAMLRKVAEATMEVLKIDFQRDDPELALEVLTNRLVEAYQDEIPAKDLVRIFHGAVAEWVDDEEVDEAVVDPEKEKVEGETSVAKSISKPTTLKFGSGKNKNKGRTTAKGKGK